MTTTFRSAFPTAPGLPDPVTESHFYAGVTAKRLIAWLFDAVFVALLCLIALPFTAFTAVFFFPLLWLVVGFLYRWATINSGSATWGMRLMSIELRESDGLRLSGSTALLHTLGYTVSVAMAPLQLISVLVMLALGRGQGLTDLILGTAMINRPAA
jgi:uncharacterized RDD family membrane protein YckC